MPGDGARVRGGEDQTHMIRKMLVGAIALVAIAAAPAAAQYDFTVSPTQVQAGGAVNISGEGCAPNSEVTVVITKRTSAEVVITDSGSTDDNGQFSIDIDLPSSLTPGFYDLEARCTLPDCSVDASSRALQGEVEGCELVFRSAIEIVTPGTPSTPGDGVDGGNIVRTGSDLNGLGLLGAGLLTAGGLVLIATKGRRGHAAA